MTIKLNYGPYSNSSLFLKNSLNESGVNTVIEPVFLMNLLILFSSLAVILLLQHMTAQNKALATKLWLMSKDFNFLNKYPTVRKP